MRFFPFYESPPPRTPRPPRDGCYPFPLNRLRVRPQGPVFVLRTSPFLGGQPVPQLYRHRFFFKTRFLRTQRTLFRSPHPFFVSSPGSPSGSVLYYLFSFFFLCVPSFSLWKVQRLRLVPLGLLESQ